MVNVGVVNVGVVFVPQTHSEKLTAVTIVHAMAGMCGMYKVYVWCV